MDRAISSSASVMGSLPLPPVRLGTVTAAAAASASASVSASSIPHCHCLRLSSQRRRRHYSSPVPQFTVSCGGVTEINESEFEERVLKANRPVLVEFVANWCGPCRLIAPAIQSLAQEYEDRLTIVKIDHDANPRLIEEYKVYGLPTVILFKNGQEVPESRREGAITKVKLKEHVDALLESLSVT